MPNTCPFCINHFLLLCHPLLVSYLITIGTRYIVYTLHIFRVPDIFSNTVQAGHQPVLHQIWNMNSIVLLNYFRDALIKMLSPQILFFVIWFTIIMLCCTGQSAIPTSLYCNNRWGTWFLCFIFVWDILMDITIQMK